MTQNVRNSNRIGNYRNPPRLRPVDSEWEWQLHGGACRGTDSAVFFAPTGESRRNRRKREIAAKTVCMSCPVRTACLRHASRSGNRTECGGADCPKPNGGRCALPPPDPGRTRPEIRSRRRRNSAEETGIVDIGYSGV